MDELSRSGREPSRSGAGEAYEARNQQPETVVRGAGLIEYRLSWDSPSPWACDAVERTLGRHAWPTYDWDLLEGWHRTEVMFTGDERMGQYHTLTKWAETREQPIRNVRLEKRTRPQLDDEWEPA
jgi:hypothetical protein